MKLTRFLAIFTSFIIAIGSASGALAQGKGHGGGKPAGGGEKHGGGPPGGGNPGRGNDNPGRGNGQQRQITAPPVQQGMPGWQGRGKGAERRVERPVRIEPQRQIPQTHVYNLPPGQAKKAERRAEQQQRQQRQVIVQAPPIWSNAAPNNYGQQRSAYVHQRNDERKALKDEQKALKRQQQWTQQAYQQPLFQRVIPLIYTQPQSYYVQPQTYYVQPQTYYAQPYTQQYYSAPVYSQPYGQQYYNFYDPYYGSYNAYPQQRFSAKELLRNLIFAVLSGGLGNSNNGYYAQTSPYYNGYSPSYAAYNPYYSSNSPNYGGYSAGYASYSPAPVYPSYSDPYYANGYGYNPQVASALPLDLLLGGSGADGGLFSQIFRQLLAVGYDKGYNDGLAARLVRGQHAFYDPYAYNNDIYDPYAASLGDNRRCLSQGYELGYDDAMNNVRSYDRYRNGSVNLVSVLIGNASQLL